MEKRVAVLNCYNYHRPTTPIDPNWDYLLTEMFTVIHRVILLKLSAEGMQTIHPCLISLINTIKPQHVQGRSSDSDLSRYLPLKFCYVGATRGSSKKLCGSCVEY